MGLLEGLPTSTPDFFSATREWPGEGERKGLQRFSKHTRVQQKQIRILSHSSVKEAFATHPNQAKVRITVLVRERFFFDAIPIWGCPKDHQQAPIMRQTKGLHLEAFHCVRKLVELHPYVLGRQSGAFCACMDQGCGE